MHTREQEELLKDWYEAMKNGDHPEVIRLKAVAQSAKSQFASPELGTLYQLLAARFHLMNKDLERASSALAAVTLPKESELTKIHYFYYFFYGIYYYQRKDYRKAIDYYLKAEPLLNKAAGLEELAEFSYKLASAYHRTYHFALSIEYAEQAFRIFKEQSHYKRMAGCEIVSGINYKDMKQYKEAEKHLHHALLYAARVKDEQIKLAVLHNFGVFYSIRNQPKTALIYLTQANELFKSDKDPGKVQNLSLLAKNYFKMNQIIKAGNTLQEAQALTKKYGYLNYFHVCEMMKAKYLEPDRLEDTYRAGIAAFIDLEIWEVVQEYGEEIAVHYQKCGRFQEACKYYTIAIEARDKIDHARSQYL